MHKDDLRQLLIDFTAERLAILQRHEASARVVSHYDFNNTYQYVIAREETHITWLQDALAEFGVGLPAPAAPFPTPDAPKGKKPQPVGVQAHPPRGCRTRCAPSWTAGGRRSR